jgi:hypothetical protein
MTGLNEREGFLASGANTSGIMAADAAALLARVSARTGDLWSAKTAPTVTLVPGTFEDDDGVVARVGPGAGDVEYLGHGRLIVLDTAGVPASFVKFATRYSAEADNVPVVRFHLTGDADAAVRVRLLRRTADGQRSSSRTGSPCQPSRATASPARSRSARRFIPTPRASVAPSRSSSARPTTSGTLPQHRLRLGNRGDRVLIDGEEHGLRPGCGLRGHSDPRSGRP